MMDKPKHLPRSTGKQVTFIAPHSLDTCFDLLMGMAQPYIFFSPKKWIEVEFGANAAANHFRVWSRKRRHREVVNGYLESQTDQMTIVHLETPSRISSLIITILLGGIWFSCVIFSLLSGGDFLIAIIIFFWFVVVLGVGVLRPLLEPSELVQDIQKVLTKPTHYRSPRMK